MKNKFLLTIKIIFLAFLSLLWLLFIQAEYEMITKPNLSYDFPIIKGPLAVYFLGILLLIISVLIFLLLISILKNIKITHLKNKFSRNIDNPAKRPIIRN
jgi:hypothetical protein